MLKESETNVFIQSPSADELRKPKLHSGTHSPQSRKTCRLLRKATFLPRTTNPSRILKLRAEILLGSLCSSQLPFKTSHPTPIQSNVHMTHPSDSDGTSCRPCPFPQISTNKSGSGFGVCYFKELDKNWVWLNGSHLIETPRAVAAVGRREYWGKELSFRHLTGVSSLGNRLALQEGRICNNISRKLKTGEGPRTRGQQLKKRVRQAKL